MPTMRIMSQQDTTVELPEIMLIADDLRRRWIALRDEGGFELAEKDEELMTEARAAWRRTFDLHTVITAINELVARVETPCWCGGWGYVPLWVAEAREHGFRFETYASPFGAWAVACSSCRSRTKREHPPNELAQQPPCPTCESTGFGPQWTTNALGAIAMGELGVRGAGEHKVSGWLPAWCGACGGWGRCAQSTAPTAKPMQSNDGAPVLVRMGRVWSLTFGGHTAYTPNSRGLTYLARVLEATRQELAALEIMTAGAVAVGAASVDIDADRLGVSATTNRADPIDGHLRAPGASVLHVQEFIEGASEGSRLRIEVARPAIVFAAENGHLQLANSRWKRLRGTGRAVDIHPPAFTCLPCIDAVLRSPDVDRDQVLVFELTITVVELVGPAAIYASHSENVRGRPDGSPGPEMPLVGCRGALPAKVVGGELTA